MHARHAAFALAVVMPVSLSVGASAQTIQAVQPSTALIGRNVGGLLTSEIGCGSVALYDASLSGEQQIIGLQSGKTIYICGYTIEMPTGTTVEMDYGVNTLATTGNTTNNSNQLTSLAATLGIVAGQSLSGTGIPNGTTVSSISGTTVTMSANATATATGVAVTFTGSNCPFAVAKLLPAFTLSLVDTSPIYRGLLVPASNALCVKPSAANAVQAVVYYSQF